MSEHFTNSDLLIQYLDGELEGEQLVAIKEKISADSSLAAELESLRMAKAAIKTYGLKKTIGSVHAEMMKERDVQTVTPVIGMRKMLRYGLRIAAVLLIVAGSTGVFQYFTATSENLFRSNFKAYQLHEMRGIGEGSFLETAYSKGHMEEVIKAFKQLNVPAAEDYFLYGNAALGLKDAPAAIASFQALQQINSKNNTHFFEDDAEYFLGLAYLDNNQPAMALPIFEKIYADKTHPDHNKINGWFMQKLRRLAK